MRPGHRFNGVRTTSGIYQVSATPPSNCRSCTPPNTSPSWEPASGSGQPSPPTAGAPGPACSLSLLSPSLWGFSGPSSRLSPVPFYADHVAARTTLGALRPAPRRPAHVDTGRARLPPGVGGAARPMGSSETMQFLVEGEDVLGRGFGTPYERATTPPCSLGGVSSSDLANSGMLSKHWSFERRSDPLKYRHDWPDRTLGRWGGEVLVDEQVEGTGQE